MTKGEIGIVLGIVAGFICLLALGAAARVLNPIAVAIVASMVGVGCSLLPLVLKRN